MAKIRRWLHSHGAHWLCRPQLVERAVVDHYDYTSEYLRGPEGEMVDVTLIAGRPVYRTERRIEHVA